MATLDKWVESSSSDSSLPQNDRDRARQRLELQRKVRNDLVAYVVINAFLIGVWAVTGAGYFWPAWVLAGWGVLLALDVWNVYFHKPITEHDIDRELDKQR